MKENVIFQRPKLLDLLHPLVACYASAHNHPDHFLPINYHAYSEDCHRERQGRVLSRPVKAVFVPDYPACNKVSVCLCIQTFRPVIMSKSSDLRDSQRA